MQISLNIPDELAERLMAGGKDPAELTLEALAMEGYRSQVFSESEVRQMLGYETRMEVHAFLKEHGAFLHYSVADAEDDRKSATKVRAKQQNLAHSVEHSRE